MNSELRSLVTHFPTSLLDYSRVLEEYDNASFIIYAGGTYLMSRGLLYPMLSPNMQIISIDEIPELKNFLRNDTYIEFGSMCTLSDLRTKGKGTLPKVLIDNIESVGFNTIRNSITVGGTIASPLYNSLIATLILLNANVEVLTKTKTKRKVKKITIKRLFDKDTPFFDMQKTLITKVRVNTAYHKFSYFKSAGNSFEDEDAVSLACIGNESHSYELAYTINGKGYCLLSEIDERISQMSFPDKNYKDEITEILSILNLYLGQMSKLQEARVYSLTKNLIETLNEESLYNIYS